MPEEDGEILTTQRDVDQYDQVAEVAEVADGGL